MKRCALMLTLAAWPVLAPAQGQDGTPAERNLQIITELLPGRYDNANQAYFDIRLNQPEAERPGRQQVVVDQPPGSAPGVFRYRAFTDAGEQAGVIRTLTLATDADPLLVRMTVGAPDGTPVCTVRWRREAGQFTGESDCGQRWQLSPEDLWISDSGTSAVQLQRARTFACYLDVPGVAGGRDEPYDRYPIDALHDQGDTHWLEIKDGREIGVSLRRVRWPMNNELGVFTRNSLVLYVLERKEDEVITHAYGWTEPRAARVGLNLQWLLVNCYLESNRDVRPYFE